MLLTAEIERQHEAAKEEVTGARNTSRFNLAKLLVCLFVKALSHPDKTILRNAQSKATGLAVDFLRQDYLSLTQ